MKRITAGIIFCLFLQTSIAQKAEFIIGVDGIISAFRGSDATPFSGIYISDVPGSIPNSTFNSYGSRAGVNSGVAATIQRIGKRDFVTGLSAGYEALTSRVKITAVQSFIETPAEGTTKLTHSFINLFPFIGKRFGSSKTSVDINLGMDIGIPLSAHEKGKAKLNDGSTITTDVNQDKPDIDLRPRLQLKAIKNHIGLQSSFSLGLTNYFGRRLGADPKAYANVFRLGIFYVL